MPVDLEKITVGNHATRRVAIEDGVLYGHTVFNDDAALERNKQIRDHGMVGNKAALGIHDEADLRMTISCPDVTQWNLFKRKHPEIARGLHSKDESIRMKACAALKQHHPEWVIQERL